jgi:DNA-binding NarL/FixJ family response regulator
MVTVLLADDHDIFRAGLKTIISDWTDFEVIGEASNGREAYEMCKKLLPDIVLMDIHMPVMNGVEATSAIFREFPTIRIVILTVSDDRSDLFEAIKNGAQGYLLKSIPANLLYSQLKGVMENAPPLSGPIAGKILNEFRRLGIASPSMHEKVLEELSPLTERETEVLKVVAEGLSDAEIAKKLCISELTVKKHLHNILGKLQLNNRVQAAVYALRTGIAK